VEWPVTDPASTMLSLPVSIVRSNLLLFPLNLDLGFDTATFAKNKRLIKAATQERN